MRRAFLISIVSMLGACDAGAHESPEAEARDIWKSRCANCHGMAGAGDGPSAAGIDPKPRSFRVPAWQAATEDARIRQVIVEGGASVGLSPLMAPNPDLKDKPEVVAALVQHIRKMQG